MGGRGAASGLNKHPYGTEYDRVLQVDNIKFVKYKNANNAKVPLETKTKGRIYVTINEKDELSFVSYYDSDGKREKTLDLLHAHDGLSPHSHTGYEHDGKADHLTDAENMLLEKVRKAWYNHKHKK